MHFGLTDEQRLLQATLREFASKELPAQRLRALFDAEDGFDRSLWQACAEVGLQGLAVPAAYGGAALERLDLALAFEVIGESALPGPLLGHALATLALIDGGSPEQRERWLPKLASGGAVAGVALCEEGGLWLPEQWRASCEAGRLHGAKRFVEAGASADLLVIGVAGGGLALVEGGAAGVSARAVDGVDRTRRVDDVTFQNAAAELLPEGVSAAQRMRDAACVLLAADALGATWRLIRATVDYTLTREQFGTKLAQFQGVKHQLANLAADAEPMRGLVWYAAYALDELPDEAALAAAAAKAHVTEGAVLQSRECIELHGGIGFTWECDVQFWAKRCMFDRTWLGAPREHRRRVADLGGW